MSRTQTQARDAAREMIAAFRRGDESGAERALDDYLSREVGDPGRSDGPGSAERTLRGLVLTVAEVAAQEPV